MSLPKYWLKKEATVYDVICFLLFKKIHRLCKNESNKYDDNIKWPVIAVRKQVIWFRSNNFSLKIAEIFFWLSL